MEKFCLLPCILVPQNPVIFIFLPLFWKNLRKSVSNLPDGFHMQPSLYILIKKNTTGTTNTRCLLIHISQLLPPKYIFIQVKFLYVTVLPHKIFSYSFHVTQFIWEWEYLLSLLNNGKWFGFKTIKPFCRKVLHNGFTILNPNIS